MLAGCISVDLHSSPSMVPAKALVARGVGVGVAKSEQVCRGAAPFCSLQASEHVEGWVLVVALATKKKGLS